MAVLDFSKLEFERLAHHHEVAAFDCGDEDMDQFLQADALDSQNAGLSNTTVILFEDRIVAYITVRTDTLSLRKLDGRSKRALKQQFDGVSSFPAVRWECLAVDKAFQNQGLGYHLFQYVIGMIYRSGIGARFLVIPAKAEKSQMYRKWGFEYNSQHTFKAGRINWMRLDLTEYFGGTPT